MRVRLLITRPSIYSARLPGPPHQYHCRAHHRHPWWYSSLVLVGWLIRSDRLLCWCWKRGRGKEGQSGASLWTKKILYLHRRESAQSVRGRPRLSIIIMFKSRSAYLSSICQSHGSEVKHIIENCNSKSRNFKQVVHFHFRAGIRFQFARVVTIKCGKFSGVLRVINELFTLAPSTEPVRKRLKLLPSASFICWALFLGARAHGTSYFSVPFPSSWACRVQSVTKARWCGIFQ